MTNWNDDRLDERFAKIDERFAKVDQRLAQLATREEMNEGLAEMRSAHTALSHTLLVGVMIIIAALIWAVGVHLA